MEVSSQSSNQPVRENPVILKVNERGSYISTVAHASNVYGKRLIEKFEGDPNKSDGSVFTPSDLRPGTVMRFVVSNKSTGTKFENLGTVAFRKSQSEGRYYLLAAETKDGKGLTIPKLKPAVPTAAEPELKAVDLQLKVVDLPASPERAAAIQSAPKAAPAPANEVDDEDELDKPAPQARSWMKKPIIKEKIVDLDENIEKRLWEVLIEEAKEYQKVNPKAAEVQNMAAMILADTLKGGKPMLLAMLKGGQFDKDAMGELPRPRLYTLAKRVDDIVNPANREKYRMLANKLWDFLGNMPKDKVLTPWRDQLFEKYKRR